MTDIGDITTFERSRLARSGRIFLICAAAWSGFGLYYLLTARNISGIHCIVEGMIGVLFAFAASANPRYRRTISNLFVASVLIGLTLESILNGMEQSLAPMFFCCGILVAALTQGTRNASKWMLLGLLLVVAVHYVFPMMAAPAIPPRLLDRVLALFTLMSVVGSCCFYAEFQASQYAEQLEEKSKQLHDRTQELDAIVGIDSLTSLRNRYRYLEDAESLFADGKAAALLSIDIDDFKTINDRFGHAVGDSILCQVSRRLQNIVGNNANLYRFGGDEFVAAIPLTDESSGDIETTATTIAERLQLAMEAGLDEPDKTKPKLGLSIGIAFYPRHAESPDALLACADKAMLKAKKGNDSIVSFESYMADEANEISKLRKELSSAIANEEFVLRYQPQVEINTGRILGVEALLRWEKDGTTISPAMFIPCLEESGRIVEVGNWVLQKACEQVNRWRHLGFEVRVSVNVSALQIQEDGFADQVIRILEEFDVPPRLLDLEITESLLVDHSTHTNQNIEDLLQFGVYFSIDDFGTGYSSLAYLKQLTIDRLKIDRSFIKDIPHEDDGVIAETIITLAKHLNMAVVAEGVETEDQLDFLHARNCDEYQGFLFSRPLPVAECTRLLEENASKRDKALA